jgi:hypothetical protein
MKAKSGKATSGGGFTSRKVVRAAAPKAEPKARAISPGGADQLGAKVGNLKGYPTAAVRPLDAGRGYQPKGPTDNVAAVGVGGGRTVMRAGGQGTHGPVAAGEVRSPRPGGRDTLAEFGPNKRGMPNFKGRT